MKKLSHLDSRGRAHMVDVGGKSVAARRAVASARVHLSPETLLALHRGDLAKGDALAVARIAGILGAKKTPDLIPLCHPLPLDQIRVELRSQTDAVSILVEARTRARTGVEMEALTGAAVAGLALIDMVKAVDREAALEEVRLELKTGGKSGSWVREGFVDPWVADPPDGRDP